MRESIQRFGIKWRLSIYGTISGLLSAGLYHLGTDQFLPKGGVVSFALAFSPGYLFGFLIAAVGTRGLTKRPLRIIACTLLGFVGFYVAVYITNFLLFSLVDSLGDINYSHWSIALAGGGLLGAAVMMCGVPFLLKLNSRKRVILLSLFGGLVSGPTMWLPPAFTWGFVLWQGLVITAIGLGLPEKRPLREHKI